MNGAVESERLTTDTTSPIVTERWQRFTLKVAFAPTASVSIHVDGTQTNALAVSPLQRSPASIALGAKLVSVGSATLFQDNVLVTTP